MFEVFILAGMVPLGVLIGIVFHFAEMRSIQN
jgi:hypothetical protein